MGNRSNDRSSRRLAKSTVTNHCMARMDEGARPRLDEAKEVKSAGVRCPMADDQ